MKTFSLKLSEELEASLARIARERNVSKSSLVREAIAEYVVAPARTAGGSFLALAGDLAGCVRGPEDLSTNPDHLRGFGE